MRRDDPGPYSLEALQKLPVPELFLRDGASWKVKLVSWFEETSGRKLYPMQVEMLLIETLSYAMSVLGEEAQMVVEQGLVAFAGAAGLERLGVNRSTMRLEAEPARTLLKLSFTGEVGRSVLVPKSSRVAFGEGFYFSTLQDRTLSSDQPVAEVEAIANLAGTIGNGYQAGSSAVWLDPISDVSVSAITTTSGGADRESDDLYRLRVANAFERISSGGSYAWYRETAMGVSPAIIDVAVIRPSPCVIELYPLTLDGAADQNLCQLVLDTFNTGTALDIRFGDDVYVLPPVAVLAQPVLTVRLSQTRPGLEDQIKKQAESVLRRWQEMLGAALAPSELEAAVRQLPEVIDAELSGIGFRLLATKEFLKPSPLKLVVVVV